MSALTTQDALGEPGAPDAREQAEEEVATSKATGAGTRGLLIQPIALAVALGVFLVWRSTVTLTETELNTMGWVPLRRSAVQHLELTFVSALVVLVIAIPLGVLLTRGPLRRVVAPVVLTVAGIGQSAPAIGLLVLLASIPVVSLGLVSVFGFGFWTAVVALVFYAALPVLRNTMVGIQSVDARLVEAGRGMGMSAAAVLFRVELPLAVPILLAGVRTALVLLVGTATLAMFISAGGLGILITTGINLSLNNLLVPGAVLVAILALAIDWLGRVVEHFASPKGLR